MSKRKLSAPWVRSGEYGPVVVCEGKYKGQVGYYDDDDGISL
jgi:hypothetical protein